jgi:hypothetical protein
MSVVPPEVVDRLAEKVAALLEPRLVEALTIHAEESAGSLVDASTVADALGVTRAWVYEHSDELGAVRLGEGDRPRLRFDVEVARERMGAASPPPRRSNGSRSPRPSTAPLLPIRGRST